MKKFLAPLFLVIPFSVFAQKPVHLSTSPNGTPIYPIKVTCESEIYQELAERRWMNAFRTENR
ncbi:hypothetical protein DBR43_00650 [Pedobacter sp. KBW06]|nr:hypothetical protein DBR43_00650 [Pedobacter sp. KBW06]